ncbi:MAG: hypothetical protein LCH93_09975 [Proteobacteria bacterium]|nr:hypothetical protein [Pseudomonadota bacterium]
MVDAVSRVGVFYLARGADADAFAKMRTFRDSYLRWRAGAVHKLYVIYKGYESAAALEPARDLFREIPNQAIYAEDDGFDIGAYFVAASRVDDENVCFLNTSSELKGQDWLLKLVTNLGQAGVGIVSCTGSYEAPQHPGRVNIPFPNPHLRSNAFMIRRDHLLAIRPDVPFSTKLDAHLFEHGTNSLTRLTLALGLKALVVGRNGRGYEPVWWPLSQTFRQGEQANLLVADNQTMAFETAPIADKRVLFRLAWGNGTLGRLT